jgi:uncharacterized protein
MIIDVHYHPIIGPIDLSRMAFQISSKLFSRYATNMKRPMSAKTYIEKAEESLLDDPDGEKIIERMDENGIDFRLMLMMDRKETPVELTKAKNKTIGELAQKHPRRLMALAGVDPRRSNASDLLKQCFEEFGCRGLKYHPDFGYDPSGAESLNLLKTLHELGGLLLTHTGPLFAPLRIKFGEVSLLADVISEFPDLPIIGAHMGLLNWRPWASLSAYNDNLYGDLAMWDEKAIGNYDFFCRELRDLIDAVGIDKVLFGTDDAFHEILRPSAEYIKIIQDLPNKAPNGIQFTNDEVDAILGGNAARLLGLNSTEIQDNEKIR